MAYAAWGVSKAVTNTNLFTSRGMKLGLNGGVTCFV